MDTTDELTTERGIAPRVAALGLALAMALGLLLVSPPRAEAATMWMPKLDCYDNGVTVDPGIGANYGDTDGYYRAWLFRWNGSSWSYTGRATDGLVSTSQMSFPNPRFANVGTGYYRVIVERWNVVGGSMAYQGATVARERHYLHGYTSKTWCSIGMGLG